MRWQFVLLGIVAGLAACQAHPANSPDPVENCAVVGDEDGNGVADCSDPACAGAPSCQPRCGNGKIDPGEQCDDGNTVNGDGCENNCTFPACGNRIVDPGEQCDDGNLVDGDSCDSNCTFPACGNRIVDAGEACDDGNRVEGDGCDSNCTVTACGNGIVTAGEQCDDGNRANGDSCDSNCTFPACGNGIVDTGERCDDGNLIEGDACDSNCTLPACGNGIKDPGEVCDDGNTVNGDACDTNCTIPACGNHVVDPGEVCDDGNIRNGDGCDNNCTVSACGNGIVALSEQCDDGNTINGDACDSNCTVPACGNGIVDAGEQCDDGNTINGDACDSNCTVPACGNGIVDAGEVCDDGNTISGDGCDSNCTIGSCGNGLPDLGEQCDDGNRINGDGCDNNCTLTACGNGVVDPGEQCDDGNRIDRDSCNNSCLVTTIGYLKASNTGDDDRFGYSIALSADGSTLAVGAISEDSAATGIGGNQTDNSAPFAGAVYVFARSGATWIQQAYLKASNTGMSDQFGYSIALSADGSTLAVGARFESSAATGVGGDQTDNSAAISGAVYVFTRSGATWTQQAYVKASNTDDGDEFGYSVALSADGSTLAVGAPFEDSAATGTGANQTDNSASAAGAAYVFTRSGTAWTQQAYVKASNTGAGDNFGFTVALSGDGATLAVGAVSEASAATGVDGGQTDDAAAGAGAAYVFARSGPTWTQQAYVKASNTGAGDNFGFTVALSGDGSSLAVGAPGEASAAAGVGHDQTDNSAAEAGAAYVFTRSGPTWTQQAYVKASNPGASDRFGDRVALSADGTTLAVSALDEASASTGVGGNQASNSATFAGAVYAFGRSGTTWSQQGYVKASNTDASDEFGQSIALSGDGSMLAVGAVFEDSEATGVGGNQANDFAADSGAVYVFH